MARYMRYRKYSKPKLAMLALFLILVIGAVVYMTMGKKEVGKKEGESFYTRKALSASPAPVDHPDFGFVDYSVKKLPYDVASKGPTMSPPLSSMDFGVLDSRVSYTPMSLEQPNLPLVTIGHSDDKYYQDVPPIKIEHGLYGSMADL